MYTTLNKQTSFFVALSFILVLFSTCKKDNCEYNTANVLTIQWQKTIGDNNTTIINSVQQTTDGGYILAGYKYNSQNGRDYWIVKLNSNTNIEWEKNSGGSSTDEATSIQQTTDGGYIVTGYSYSANKDVTNNNADVVNNNVDSNAWILKLNANGDTEWQKTYGGSDSDGLTNIKQTADNGYIAVGYTYSADGDIANNNGHSDAWILKLNANGNIEWSKNFGGSDGEWMNDTQQTTDGGYLIVGRTYSSDGNITNNHGYIDLWIIKLQVNGNLQWQKTYGGNSFDRANCIQKTNDGHYIIVGSTYSDDGDITSLDGDEDAWVLKINDLGNILQQTTVGIDGHETTYNILQIHNNNFLIAGSLQNIYGGEKSIFIASLDANYTLLWKWQIPQKDSNNSAIVIFETTDCNYILFGNQTFENNLTNSIIIKLK